MRPIAYIRKKVFDNIPQAAFGALAGTSQTTVSRWENGDLDPGASEMERIRAAAIEQGKPWNDRWFFELPEEAEVQQ